MDRFQDGHARRTAPRRRGSTPAPRACRLRARWLGASTASRRTAPAPPPPGPGSRTPTPPGAKSTVGAGRFCQLSAGRFCQLRGVTLRKYVTACTAGCSGRAPSHKAAPRTKLSSWARARTSLRAAASRRSSRHCPSSNRHPCDLLILARQPRDKNTTSHVITPSGGPQSERPASRGCG
eukprot:COSAG01_NODE_3847_length_5644_cov_25.352209_3_plen_179_part_00